MDVLLFASVSSLQCAFDVLIHSVVLKCQNMRAKKALIKSCGDRVLGQVKRPNNF